MSITALHDAAVSAFALALFLGQGIGALGFGTVLAAGGYRHGFAAAAMLILTVWSRPGMTAQPQLVPADGSGLNVREVLWALRQPNSCGQELWNVWIGG